MLLAHIEWSHGTIFSCLRVHNPWLVICILIQLLAIGSLNIIFKLDLRLNFIYSLYILIISLLLIFITHSNTGWHITSDFVDALLLILREEQNFRPRYFQSHWLYSIVKSWLCDNVVGIEGNLFQESAIWRKLILLLTHVILSFLHYIFLLLHKFTFLPQKSIFLSQQLACDQNLTRNTVKLSSYLLKISCSTIADNLWVESLPL